VLQAQNDQELLAAMAVRARNAVRNGVTTVRDLGDRNYLTTRLTADDPRFPTILTAGPPITSPGGHCFYLGGEVASIRQAVNAVAEHCARGVDVIKIMVTGGILTKSSDPARLQFDMDTVRAVVDTAHARERTIAAHAHTREGIELALLCGADTVEHATFASEDAFSYDSELAEAVADSQCWVCPTYVARPGVEWQSKHFSWRGSVLARLHHAGVRLAGGTDAGVKQGLDHASVGWVVSSWVAAGIPVADSLVAVTYGAAQACRVGHKKGVLAAGWDADLIAVRSNPLANPLTITEPALVMNRGHILVDKTSEKRTAAR
jgi:imidazolonepropionase-like amidohydrolase